MSLAGLFITAVVSVPPGHMVVDHSQPAHFTQPTVRQFVRRPVDEARGKMWNHYVEVLDRLWADYRNAGSTKEAWQRYKKASAAARRCYVYQDPYLLAQIYRYVDCDEAWCAGCPHAACCRGELEPDAHCDSCGGGDDCACDCDRCRLRARRGRRGC